MRKILPVALALALMGAGCDNSAGGDPSPPTTVTLTPETFTGTVDPGGSDSHGFTIAQAGEVDVTLTAAGPPATILMGLGVGTPSGSTCQLLTGGSVTTRAGTTPQLVGSANAGSYCVAVYDVGNQAAQVTYSVTVAHP